MENQLPIDIHLTKLLDWILDRRHCPRDWQKNVLPIRNKINLAIQDMPEHPEITNLLSGSSIHNFNCLKIVEILKETEKNSKNIFGIYSSQRMKDWSSIVSAYQKNNIYLAEAASILQRNVAYEIPALKKQIHKSQQSQTECDEKQVSLTKSINEINLQIKQFCAELGIHGANVSAELKELPKHTTQVFDEIVQKCKQLEKAVEFYANYAEYFFQRKSSESLPVLTHLIQKGNTTVYEWRTGAAPKQIEKPDEISQLKFGDAENEENVSDEINFDVYMVDASNVNLNTGGEIDWGDFDAINTDKAGAELTADTVDIESLRNEIVVEGSGVYVPEDHTAKGNDAFNLLELLETRNLLLNDLSRLEAFLKQKLNEMKSESDNLLITTILQDAPKVIQFASEKDLKKFSDLTRECVGYFRLKKVEKLLRINDAPKYLAKLYEQYAAKLRSIERCNRNKLSLEAKAKELRGEENELNEKLKLFIAKTKELQKYVCDDLSKKYNGVRINLMGEINLL